jgi:hypothetical protein
MLVDIMAVRCLRSAVAIIFRDCRRTLVESMDAASRRVSICVRATVGGFRTLFLSMGCGRFPLSPISPLPILRRSTITALKNGTNPRSRATTAAFNVRQRIMNSTSQSSASKSDKGAGSARSRGGIYLVAGLLFLVLGGFAAAMPGGYWPIFLISFAFNLVGLFVARGWPRRILAVALAGISGGLFVQDFLIWMDQ